MALLFFLPLLFAHPPINVQPRASLLRRMPMLFGKRAHPPEPSLSSSSSSVPSSLADLSPSIGTLLSSGNFALLLTDDDRKLINDARNRLELAKAVSLGSGHPLLEESRSVQSGASRKSGIRLKLITEMPEFLKAVTDGRSTHGEAMCTSGVCGSLKSVDSINSDTINEPRGKTSTPDTYNGQDNNVFDTQSPPRRRLRLQLLKALISDAVRSPPTNNLNGGEGENSNEFGLGFDNRIRMLQSRNNRYDTSP